MSANITMGQPIQMHIDARTGSSMSVIEDMKDDDGIEAPTLEELGVLPSEVKIEDPIPTISEEEAEKEEEVTIEYEEGSVESYTGGKFKTLEDLAKAYNNSAKVYQANQELEKKIKDYSSIPDAYVVPDNIQLGDAEKEDLISIATNASLSQTHFNKICEQYQGRLSARNEKIEKNRNSLGKENLNLLQDYYSKNYPVKATQVLMQAALENTEVALEALNHRQELLSSRPPHLGSMTGSSNTSISDEQYQKISNAHFSNPNNQKLQEEFIKAASLRASQRERNYV